MTANLSKTKELFVRVRFEASLHPPFQGTEQVDHVKLLGIIFHHSPYNCGTSILILCWERQGNQSTYLGSG